MAAEIDRIVDRKLIRNRVHYLVVWRGFGDDSNTWESRMDLVADGYSSVIRDFEENYKSKKSRDGSSTPTSSRSRSPSRGRSPARGRSPGRPKGSKSRVSKSPGVESRGRSRSNSVARKKSAARAASEDNNNNSSSEVAPRRPAARKSKSKAAATTASAAAVVTPATSVEVTETAFVSAKQHSDDDTDVLLRSTIQALGTPAIRTVAADAASADKLAAVTTTTTTTTTKTTSPAVRKSPRGAKASPASAVKTESKTIALAYEDSDSRVVAQTIETIETTTTSHHQHSHVSETSSVSSATALASTPKALDDDDDGSSLLLAPHAHRHHVSSARHKDGGVRDMLSKMTERGWLVSFLSVAVVVGSLLASQLAPRSTPDDLWRAWLPFLTPVVALLLFFHQRDDRASAKWIAIALSWRCAGELLVLVEATPREFATVAASCAAIAHLALVLALGAIVRNREHESSKVTLVALTVSALALALSDSWAVTTANPALESRVILMSLAVLGIALSPALTARADDDE